MFNRIVAFVAGIGALFAATNPRALQGGDDWTGPTGWAEPEADEAPRSEAVDVLARTAWGEARGDGTTGMHGVCNVVMNCLAYARGRGGYWWGNSVKEICLKDYQFSAWNANDPNRGKMQSVTVQDAAFADAVRLARQAVNGNLPDITNGATHYHTDAVRPSWSGQGEVAALVGSHKFYRGIG